jgi:hypothetical protein
MTRHEQELDDFLRQSPLPVRPPSHWDLFHARLNANLKNLHNTPASHLPPRWIYATATAAIVATLSLVALFLPRQIPVESGYLRLYEELTKLFPEQINAIVKDELGIHILLWDSPQPSLSSAPLFVRACKATGCKVFITFSGNRLPVNGDNWDFLTDRNGMVLVAGRTTAHYRIEAKPLEYIQ